MDIDDKPLDLKTVHMFQDMIDINQITCCWLHKNKIYVLEVLNDQIEALYTCSVIQVQPLADYKFEIQKQIFGRQYTIVSDKHLGGLILAYEIAPPEDKTLKYISIYKLDFISILNQKRRRSLFLGKQLKYYKIIPQQGQVFTTSALNIFPTYYGNILLRKQKYEKKISLTRSKQDQIYQGRNCQISDDDQSIFALRKVKISEEKGQVKYPIFYNSQALFYNGNMIMDAKLKKNIHFHKILFLRDTNLITYIPYDKCQLNLYDLRMPDQQYCCNLEIEGGLEMNSDKDESEEDSYEKQYIDEKQDPYDSDEQMELKQAQIEKQTLKQDQKDEVHELDNQHEQKFEQLEKQQAKNKLLGLTCDDENNILLWISKLLIRIAKGEIQYIHSQKISQGIKEDVND